MRSSVDEIKSKNRNKLQKDKKHKVRCKIHFRVEKLCPLKLDVDNTLIDVAREYYYGSDINRLWQLCINNSLGKKTFFMAVGILRTVTTNKHIELQDKEITAISCLLIAAKLEETRGRSDFLSLFSKGRSLHIPRYSYYNLEIN